MENDKYVNEVLLLKGKYSPKDNEQKGGPINLGKDKVVPVSRILDIKEELLNIYDKWKNIDVIEGLLISVQYNRVIPKSSRVDILLKQKSIITSSTIVGAKLKGNKHFITHYIANRDAIIDTTKLIDSIYEFASNYFGADGIIKPQNFNILKGIGDPINYQGLSISKSVFRKVIVEISNIEHFVFPSYEKRLNDSTLIISLYDTGVNGVDLLKKLKLYGLPGSLITPLNDEGTVLQIDKNTYELLLGVAPFFVANATTNLLSISDSETNNSNQELKFIVNPTNEPTIGVIDTSFKKDVYFKEWVNVHEEYFDGVIVKNDKHGTEIDSIIVDGSFINKDRFDDGCGNFKVEHFVVAAKEGTPSTTVMKNVKEIIMAYKNINVWNISLGSPSEIDDNYVSFEAEILDKLQYNNKKLVIVVSGTNLPEDKMHLKGTYRIGAPADSINSIVVNAVDYEGNVTDYARCGGVLSFFNKPDISTFGGSNKKAVVVCNDLGREFRAGTSFAAPWIARKMSYLIDKMGLSREVAKALIIDAAAGWDVDYSNMKYKGYGIVPPHIKDILMTRKDEIRFILKGNTLAYNTYNYELPIPLSDDKYPFVARATLCYFPNCTRNQGVDYTNTELSIKFGRIGDGKQKIIDINMNKQDDTDSFTYEEDARTYQRKWDNVKHISMELKENNRALKSYSNKMWGISITSKERVEQSGYGLPFGVVITLREIYGKNRIESFKEACRLKGWQVDELVIHETEELYNNLQEKLDINE